MDKLDTNIVWQIGVVVKDAEAAGKKVAEIFGFDSVPPVRHNGQVVYDGTNCIYNGQPTEGNFDGVFFDFGSVQIEFMCPVGDGPSVWKDFLNEHGQGIHHIAWKVKDTDETKEFFESKGLKMVQRGNWRTGTYAYYDALDVMGIVIETLEFDDERKAGDSFVPKWYERRHD